MLEFLVVVALFLMGWTQVRPKRKSKYIYGTLVLREGRLIREKVRR